MPLDESLPTENEPGNLQRQQDLAHYANAAYTQLQAIFAGTGIDISMITNLGSMAGQSASSYVLVSDGVVVPTTLFTSGLPSDVTGNDGDSAYDPATGITYGPKGTPTPGSWVGVTQYNPMQVRNIRSTSSTALTLGLSDMGRFIRGSNSTLGTYTVPTDSSVSSVAYPSGWPIGASIKIQMAGTGPILVAGSGITFRRRNAATHSINIPSTSSGATITDPQIQSYHFGQQITGTGIPANSFVGTVTPGVSFLLSSTQGSQTNVAAIGTGAVVATLGNLLELTTQWQDGELVKVAANEWTFLPGPAG